MKGRAPLLLLVAVLLAPVLSLAQLQVGFYRTRCPNAEAIIRGVVQRRFSSDRSVTAALLRMHFHDCFVRGCDASILIDPTPRNPSPEKNAGPNLTVRGYEIIDEAKQALETACPGIVSCADIITVATRDAVSLAGGPAYAVPTGRRDGTISRSSEVNLPGPSFTVSQAFSSFRAKNLTLEEMVILLGAHTVGVAHCSFFSDRLSNFQGTGRPDPTMSATLRASLTRICAGPGDPTAFLDQNTSFVVDNAYYGQLKANRGILQIDQELALDTASARFVNSFAADGGLFAQKFVAAMVKMGGIEVLTGINGQIRTRCNAANSLIQFE